jgi:hypothetical protein
MHNDGYGQWILPFLTTFTPDGGQCTEPKPYEDTNEPTSFTTITAFPTTWAPVNIFLSHWPTWSPTVSPEPTTPKPTWNPTISSIFTPPPSADFGLIWTQVGDGTDIDGKGSSDYSSDSVSLASNGKTVAICAPYSYGNGYHSGHVRVYLLSGSSSTQIGNDISGESSSGDESGSSVAIRHILLG